jgi:hypothetical protein
MIEDREKKTGQNEGSRRTQFQPGNKLRLGKKSRSKLNTIDTLIAECQKLYGPDTLTCKYGKGKDAIEIRDPRHLAMIKFSEAVAQGKPWAIKMMIEQDCGRPRQQVDIKATSEAGELDPAEVMARVEARMRQRDKETKTVEGESSVIEESDNG